MTTSTSLEFDVKLHPAVLHHSAVISLCRSLRSSLAPLKYWKQCRWLDGSLGLSPAYLAGGNASETCLKMLAMHFAGVHWPASLSLHRRSINVRLLLSLLLFPHLGNKMNEIILQCCNSNFNAMYLSLFGSLLSSEIFQYSLEGNRSLLSPVFHQNRFIFTKVTRARLILQKSA